MSEKTRAGVVPRAETAASALRSRILEGSIKPGTRLAELAVARELGVSRVPVREALFALERDGLVEFSATGRAFVKELSPRDFEELFVLRLTLEPVAARLAAPALRTNVSSLKRNVAAMRRANEKEVTRLDLDFHELIFEASDNGRLLKLWRSLRNELELWLGRLHRILRTQSLDLARETVSAHQRLIACFQEGTALDCEREARQHVLGWREWMPVAGSEVESAPPTAPPGGRRRASKTGQG